MIIKIGNNSNDGNLYLQIQQAQLALCESSDNCVMISDLVTDFTENGVMTDEYHYTQEGYNVLDEVTG
jgi:hypothetical protein